jgi:hypothetical protein
MNETAVGCGDGSVGKSVCCTSMKIWVQNPQNPHKKSGKRCMVRREVEIRDAAEASGPADLGHTTALSGESVLNKLVGIDWWRSHPPTSTQEPWLKSSLPHRNIPQRGQSKKKKTYCKVLFILEILENSAWKAGEWLPGARAWCGEERCQKINK